MKLKYSTFINCWTVLTCAFLITLIIVMMNSNISSVNEEQVFSGLKNGNLFFTFYNKTKSAFFSNDVLMYTSKYSNPFNDSSKIETQTINQNGELHSRIMGSANQTKRNESETILCRKRRYLLFPEGSSFQIVFDLIIPIVDYTNYAIMGITCAVAWELPSKAPSEIENELIDKLNDGTYGLSRNDSVNNIEYIDTPHYKKPLKDDVSHIIYIQPSEYSYKSSSETKDYYRQPATYPKSDINYYKGYNIPRPVYDRNQEKPTVTYNSATTYNAPFKLKSINNERIDTLIQPATWERNYAKRPEATKPVADYPSRPHQNNFPRPSKHAVYHIMGKRSIFPNTETEHTNPWLEKLDRLHLSYHRSSRHSLYSKIEGMFNNQGKNGTECVLRALCETGQRRHEREPGGLMAEILRAIFTLPKADNKIHKKEYHPKHRAWDEAYENSRKCSDIYPLCENFLWS